MNTYPNHLTAIGVQRSEHVYSSLLQDITSGRYRPGEQLVIDDIASALGISITPVRDALARLESHGVVTRLPYQGSFVRRFDDHEIQDLYEVRAGLEVLAVTLACGRIRPEQLERLARLQREGERAQVEADLARYQACNHDFHATILEAAGNQLLIRTMATITLQMQMMIAQTIKVPGRPGRANQEHLALIACLAEGDVSGAERMMKNHVYGALEDLRVKPLP